ncbi:MAG TPA: hypothetical protein VF676_04405 [Flavobacterium sp.]|jgi:hypothetical protein
MKNAVGLVFFFLIVSCSNRVENVEKAFYYWKSDSNYLSDSEDSIIDHLQVKTLYVKFFEVEKHDVMGFVPISKTNLRAHGWDSIRVIPTVYIRNEVFLNSSRGSLDTLADNINFLINKYADRFGTRDKFSEYQMDCDWTLKTKDNYFYFLKKIKQIAKIQISCTLRLYPYKYAEKMGVPPVDKATLMCYNLISPLENPHKNSILDTDELAAYLNKKQKYPLHLDIALPVYSWMQVYQNNVFTRVLYYNSESLASAMRPIRPFWFEMTQDVVVEDFYLRVGDKIKYEKVSTADVDRAIDIIKKNVELDDTTTVTLFHLDQPQLTQYRNENLSHFFSAFSE